MTLAILRGERVPTEEEAFLEDGGTVPSDAPAWWDPPQEEDDDDEYGDDVDEVDDDDEAEDGGGGWESGEHEEAAGPGTDGEGTGGAGSWGGGQQLDRMFEAGGHGGEGIQANGFGKAAASAAEGAHGEQARAGSLDVNLSSKSNGTWPTFPPEQSNGGGTPLWATASTIE